MVTFLRARWGKVVSNCIFRVFPFLFCGRGIWDVGGRLVSVTTAMVLLATYNNTGGAGATRTSGFGCAIRRFTSLRVLHCHMPKFRGLALGRGRLMCCLARTTLRKESVLFSRGKGCGLAVQEVLRAVCASCTNSEGDPSFIGLAACLGHI